LSFSISNINISNILNRKEIVKEIPPYLKNQSIHNYLEIMFPIDVFRFSEIRTMRNHLSETLMLNDIQITSDYMSRWVALKRRVGAVTRQRVLSNINISNILNRKEIVKEIPPYLKNQSVPIVSYSYTNSIGRKIFNYKEALQDINIEECLKNPLPCDCSH
jgi:ERCC4-related helicase